MDNKFSLSYHNFMANKKTLFILLALGIATHFLFFGRPNQTVFDEVHFGKFVSGYYTHEYYFDIHPPLGKLMIAGFGKLFNFKPDLSAGEAGFSFANIGDKFPDSKYLALRFLPSLAGALIPAVIFLFALEMGLSRRAAFAAGMLIALENALLTQTRFMLMDGFLILFGFLALLFYFRKKMILAGVFAGLAISIKWTGLAFLAIMLILETIKIFKIYELKRIWRTAIKLVLIPILIYFAVFAIHFTILNKPGPGDAYMSPAFHSKNILKKFIELNTEMYSSNKRLTASHPYSSQWYSWPFMTRPIFYWVDSAHSAGSGQARIYFLGNPIIWWASAIGMITGLALILLRKADKRVIFLAAAYFLNLLPFIGIKRVMFLYHYLIALIFAILMLVYLIDGFGKLTASQTKNRQKIFAGLIIVSAIAFIYFAPLNYGLNLSPKAYEARVWLPSWR